MAYLEQEQQIAFASNRQAEWLEDIAESLRIISGRTTLKENRLREEINNLYYQRNSLYDEEEIKKIDKQIYKLEDEISQDRLKREGGEE